MPNYLFKMMQLRDFRLVSCRVAELSYLKSAARKSAAEDGVDVIHRNEGMGL